MTPWRYYRERNYKRKHIGITEDILISQQKLWSNFLWDTSLKLRYHTYGIAWRDDTYLLSNRMFHFQPGRHSTKTAARRPMRHFGRKMSKVYFFVHTRQDRGCEKPRRQHLSPSRPGIRLLAKKTCKTLGPKTPSAKHSMGIADFSMSLEHQSVELGSALWQPSNVEIPFKKITRSYRSKKIHPRWEKKNMCRGKTSLKTGLNANKCSTPKRENLPKWKETSSSNISLTQFLGWFAGSYPTSSI